MTRIVPACPECGGTNLEWQTRAFFRVTGAGLDQNGNPDYVEIDLNGKPVSVDYEADGEIYCNDCGEFSGRPKGWSDWVEVTDPESLNPGRAEEQCVELCIKVAEKFDSAPCGGLQTQKWLTRLWEAGRELLKARKTT